jgi:hypothetical protein
MKILSLITASVIMISSLQADNEKMTLRLGEFDAVLKHNIEQNKNDACKIYKFYDANEDKLLHLETKWAIFKNYYQKYLFDMGSASARCFSIKETNPENYMRRSRKSSEKREPSNTEVEAYIKDVIMNGSNLGLVSKDVSMPGRDELFNIDTDKLVTDEEIDIIARYVANGFKGSKKDRRTYLGVCKNCHRSSGRGMVFVAPPISKGHLKGLVLR